MIGTIMNIGGLYLMSDAVKKGESTVNGVILASTGSIMSFLGFLQVGNAGDDLKKASGKMKIEKND